MYKGTCMNTSEHSKYLIDGSKPIQIKGNHFPWGMYLGELRHPARGRIIPAIIESKGSCIFFNYNKKDMSSLTHLIKDMVGSFVLSVIENQVPIINVLDLSLNNPFTSILQLNYNNNVSLKSSQEDFEQFNKYTKALIRQRQTEVLDQKYHTIAIYNEHCDPRAQEFYYINIINFNDYIASIQRQHDLVEILDVAETVGIKFLFYVDKNELNHFIDSIGDDKQRTSLELTTNEVLGQYPHITVSGGDIFLGKGSKNDIFTQLNDLIDTNNLTLELSTNIFDDILNRIDKVLGKLSEEQDKPFLKIEVGVSPNGKIKRYFELGESNEAYHAFIIGKTGTGKTVFLDHIIKGIANQFSPSEAELYLFDYKEGIGFAKYANLPHTRVLMLDHSNENAIYTYIKEFQSMIFERGQLFNKYGIEKLSEYNNLFPQQPLSRVYLIVDEVQKLFRSNDADIFNELIEDVARRGRSVGLTMIMATQTLSGYSVPDVILSQFALKIAFRVDAQDSISFLSIGNNAPIYLNKHECIINDKEGVIEANKKVLVNAPIANTIIKKLADRYPKFNKKVIIDSSFSHQKSQDINCDGEQEPIPSKESYCHHDNQETISPQEYSHHQKFIEAESGSDTNSELTDISTEVEELAKITGEDSEIVKEILCHGMIK